MKGEPSPDGKGLIFNYGRCKCELRGGKLRDCGCHPLWTDRERSTAANGHAVATTPVD